MQGTPSIEVPIDLDFFQSGFRGLLEGSVVSLNCQSDLFRLRGRGSKQVFSGFILVQPPLVIYRKKWAIRCWGVIIGPKKERFVMKKTRTQCHEIGIADQVPEAVVSHAKVRRNSGLTIRDELI
jgi:hypothetical protein